jgi:perosamine synthetase
MYVIGIKPGDEVIVPAITFAATANCVVYQGGIPVFADVEADTLLINPDEVKSKITANTKAIIAVDYAGQTCDYDALRDIANQYGLALVADSCHALGAEYRGHKTGTLADMTVFSFHPVKHITTGEGGMVVTDDTRLAARAKIFRNHGITSDHRQRAENHTWEYDMVDLGYNYRLSDIQCALGISQLKKLPNWLVSRRKIASLYEEAFAGTEIRPLKIHQDRLHAYHLYVVKVNARNEVFSAMRRAGIAVNVHYKPIYMHSYYQHKLSFEAGLCTIAEKTYEHILTIPLYPAMNLSNVKNIAKYLGGAVENEVKF